jgi:hypothetical protein
MAYRFLSISRIAIALSAALEIVECDRVASGVHIAFLGEERTHLEMDVGALVSS